MASWLCVWLLSLAARHGVCRVHHGHDELAEHLDLLDLGERDLVAGLHGLQIADGGLILEFEALQRRLFGREVLGLRLRALEGAIQGIERGSDAGLGTLHTGDAGDVVPRIELLELLRKALTL